jgi:N-acyl amino acid synthase of PEP-CTERM/exosortase system
MRLGVLQALIRMSARTGITHWCALMEAQLMRMLAAMAIDIEPIGRAIEHHGWRQPCIFNVEEVLGRLRRERPAFWEVLTLNGALYSGQ